MKNEDLIVLAIAGAACFYIMKTIKKSQAAPVNVARPADITPAANRPDNGPTTDADLGRIGNDWTSLIQESDGWKYYTDGTAIGPDGKYYKGGQLIFSPMPENLDQPLYDAMGMYQGAVM